MVDLVLIFRDLDIDRGKNCKKYKIKMVVLGADYFGHYSC